MGDQEGYRPLTRQEIVTLQDYMVCEFASVQRQFKMCQEVHTTRFDAMDKAVEVAKELMEARLHNMNGVWQQMAKQSETFVTMDVYKVERKTMIDKLEKLDSRTAQVENLRANINGRLWAIGVFGTILIFVVQFMIHYVFKVHP